MTKPTSGHAKSQSDKFKELAREVGADPDEKRWEERLRKVVRPQQPKSEPADTWLYSDKFAR